MLETLQDDLGCNRTVEGLCLYVKLNLANFTAFCRHVANSTSVETILYL